MQSLKCIIKNNQDIICLNIYKTRSKFHSAQKILKLDITLYKLSGFNSLIML